MDAIAEIRKIYYAATKATIQNDLGRAIDLLKPGVSSDKIARAFPKASEIGFSSLVQDDAVAKVSIVGVGIRSNPQLAAKMFEVLAERQINLLAVSTSEIKVSALIAEDQLDLAVRALHTAFGLDAEETA